MTAENPYIAYAIVIDDTVTAIAHSDEEKIEKTTQRILDILFQQQHKERL